MEGLSKDWKEIEVSFFSFCVKAFALGVTEGHTWHLVKQNLQLIIYLLEMPWRFLWKFPARLQETPGQNLNEMQCKYRAHGPYSRKGTGCCGYMVLVQDGEFIQGMQWFSPATSEIFGISVIWVKHQPQFSTSPGLTAAGLTWVCCQKLWKVKLL